MYTGSGPSGRTPSFRPPSPVRPCRTPRSSPRGSSGRLALGPGGGRDPGSAEPVRSVRCPWSAGAGRRGEEPLDGHRPDPRACRRRRRTGGSPIVGCRRVGPLGAHPGPGASDLRAGLLEVVPRQVGRAGDHPDRGRRAARGEPRRCMPSDAPVIMHGIEKELGRPRLRAGRLLLPDRSGGRDPTGRRVACGHGPPTRTGS